MKKSILKVPQAGIRVALRSYPETRPLPLAISTRIPLELFELIIDFLNGDRETLKVCSSVSKAWLPCCRYHLFRRTLVSPANAFQLLALVNFSWSDPSIRFVSSIRHLVIQSQDDRSQHKLRFHNILHNFLSSSLISLEMTGASAFDGNGQLISHLRALPNLCRLTMGSFLFSSFRRFIEVICAPPNLGHLSLTGVEWGDSDTTDLLDIPTIFSLSPRLEYLEIFLSRLHQFLDWLLWTSDQAELSIKTLHVGGIGIEETAALSQFLGVLGPRLKHLKMYMRFWLDHIDLSQNTLLQSLCISHYDLAGDAGLPKFLSRISSSQISRIDMLILSDPGQLNAFNWSPVEQILVSLHFQNLQILQISTPGIKDALGLPRRLPSLAAMGVLQVKE